MHRFKIFRQLESADCGLACVQMVCNYYGKKQSLSFLKKLCSVSRVGVSVADVDKCCKDVGLQSVGVEGSVEQLSRAPLPAILYWNNEHFVVLYKIKDKKKGKEYYIADPAFGRNRCNEQSFNNHWIGKDGKGIAILTAPTQKFYLLEDHEESKHYHVLHEILHKYSQHKTQIIVASILVLLAALFNWFLPIFYQKAIDNGVLLKNQSVVIKLFLSQFALFVGYLFSNCFSSIITIKLNYYIGVEYLSELLNKIISLPVKYFDTRINTDFIKRIEDQRRLQSFISFHIIEFIFVIVNMIVFSGLLAYYNYVALLIFVVFSVLSVCWNVYFLKERKYIDYAMFRESAENQNIIYELIYGMSEIKINNAQQRRIAVWKENQEQINQISLRSIYLNLKQQIGSASVDKLKDIVIIGLCAYFVIEDNLTLGTLISVSYILGQLSGPISQLQALIKSFQDAKLSMDRIADVQEKENEVEGWQSKEIPYNVKIELRKVCFKYEGSFNPFIFNELNLTIPKNQITAIVGNSGSGKSTLLKLLLGFYIPQVGSVNIDDINLANINIEAWRQKCGVVMQDGYIFSGTIAENIALGYESIDYHKVAICAKMASIEDFIERLPGKYYMKIGKAGIDLSNGQKQRILIARAIYKNPELVILDEATSSLDTTNEHAIMSNLAPFFKGRTVVIVAHRLSTVVNADNIIYLEAGKIMESGTHKDLVNKRGRYYELIRNQLELETK